MADYIERDKVLEKSQLACKIALIDADPEQCDVAFSDDFAVAVDDIVEIPAADVAPVVHGRWVGTDKGSVTLWSCSECKTLGSPQWKGCPVCLARMDGDKK